MMEFYINLPSNSSKKYFQDNTLSHYRTHLPRRIDLEGDWQVGLTELVYNSHSTKFVHEEYGNENVLQLKDGDSIEIINFPAKEYKSVNEFLDTLFSQVKNNHLGQKAVEAAMKAFRVVYNEPHKYTPYSGKGKSNVLIHNNEKIQFEMMHFDSVLTLVRQLDSRVKNENLRTQIMSAALGYLVDKLNYFHDANMNNPNSNLCFLYLNVINPVISGDVLANTLRVVELKPKGGSTIFNPVYYHSVNLKNFQTLELEMRYDTGEYVNFYPSSQPTLAVLHFKRR